VERKGVHLVTSLGAAFFFKRFSFTSVGVGGHPNSFSYAHNKIQVLNNKKRRVFCTTNGQTTSHSYDILGARMLWKPKEVRILKNLKKNYRSTSVIW
jgi:hypothetical protein